MSVARLRNDVQLLRAYVDDFDKAIQSAEDVRALVRNEPIAIAFQRTAGQVVAQVGAILEDVADEVERLSQKERRLADDEGT